MAPKARKINKKQTLQSFADINFESALCPICCSVLIEPVTLPCAHNFCLNCFNQSVNNAALSCPLCRTRISSWLRVARKESTLINQPLWEVIKDKFGSYVDLKLNGADDNFDKNLPKAPRILACRGEIKQEYEKQRANEYQEILKERQDEELKSQKLILELQEEEALARKLEEEKLKQDEELARKLAEEERLAALAKKEPLSTPKSRFSKGPMDAFVKSGEKKRKSKVLVFDSPKNIFPPGLPITQRRQFLLDDSVDYMTRLLNTESDNTIDQEITHIKPITLVPKTPPKFDKNGKILENSIIRTTPIRLSQENVEYHPVKSPVNNLIAEHHSDNISAFKSTSPPKLEPICPTNPPDVETIKKLITFEHPETKPPSPIVYNNSPCTTSFGSPFMGFTQTNNDHFTRFTKLLNELYPDGSSKSDDCDNSFNVENNNEEGFDEALIISEQKRLEEILIQERKDYELARKLFEELNAPETKKYSLRAAVTKRPETRRVQSRKRQSTIQEICSRKKLKMQ